jgi:tetratricopeptide (TPR) repeat protein
MYFTKFLLLYFYSLSLFCSAQEDQNDTSDFVYTRIKIKTQTSILKLNPNNTNALLKRSQLRSLIYDYDGATDDMLTHLKNYPNDYQAITTIAVYKYYQYNFKESLEMFNKSISIAPNFRDNYISRSNLYTAINDYPKAISDLEIADKLDPNNPNILYDLAKSHNEIQSYVESYKYFDKVIQLDTSDVVVYEKCLLGKGYAKNGLLEYKEAIKMFNEAIRINPKSAKAYNNRGSGNYGLANYKAALVDMDMAIILNPNYAKAFNKRGDTKMRLNDFAGALSDLNKSILLDSTDANAYFHRGRCRFGLNNTAGAIEDLTKAIELYPTYYEAFIQRGLAYDKLKDYNKSRADQKEAEVIKMRTR